MTDLTEDELWFIRMAFGQGASTAALVVSDLRRHMMRKLRFMQVDEVIEALVTKNVLQQSPDKRQVRLTELGIESFRATLRSQAAWERGGPPPTSPVERGGLVIRAGEAFAGDRLVRDVLRRAQRTLAITDPYIGATLFDYLDDLPSLPDVRILTSERTKAAARTAYAAFKQQRGQVAMRLAQPQVLHDRYVLWDELSGVHLGHSLKDLGKKDTQVTWLKDAAEQWRLFETRWAGATPV